MTEQEIYKKIEDTYNSDKGKNFITHLLRSFFPVHKTHKLFSNEDKKLKMVDCITGEKLVDVVNALDTVSKTDVASLMVKKMGVDMKGEVDEELNKELVEARENIGTIAWTCKGSNKLVSQETLQQLLNFYQTQMLVGNKHINWIANDERGKETINYAKKKGYVKNEKEEKVVKKKLKGATMSLGDNSVLQQLKERMENGTD